MRVFVLYSVMYDRHNFSKSYQALYDLLRSNNSTSMGQVPATRARLSDPEPETVLTFDDE
jgi:hypothetical protein